MIPGLSFIGTEIIQDCYSVLAAEFVWFPLISCISVQYSVRIFLKTQRMDSQKFGLFLIHSLFEQLSPFIFE